MFLNNAPPPTRWEAHSLQEYLQAEFPIWVCHSQSLPGKKMFNTNERAPVTTKIIAVWQSIACGCSTIAKYLFRFIYWVPLSLRAVVLLSGEILVSLCLLNFMIIAWGRSSVQRNVSYILTFENVCFGEVSSLYLDFGQHSRN